MKRREFIALSAARRHGRSRRVRSSRAGAAHRRAHDTAPPTIRTPNPLGGVPAGAAAVRLDRRPQRADRHSLGRGPSRPHSQIRSGIGRARAGCHPCHRQRDPWSLLQATRTVPIVFTAVPDPVGAGFVDSLARPGGNATGFMMFEYSLSGEMV